MGRKKSVELQGIVKDVVELHTSGKTIRQIVSILNEKGYRVSYGAIQRSVKDIREVAESYRRSVEEARAIVADSGSNTEVLEVAVNLLAQKLFKAALAMDDIDSSKPAEVLAAMTKLSASQAMLSQTRVKFFRQGWERAKTLLEGQLATLLEKEHPDVLRVILDALDKLEAPDGAI